MTEPHEHQYVQINIKRGHNGSAIFQSGRCAICDEHTSRMFDPPLPADPPTTWTEPWDGDLPE